MEARPAGDVLSHFWAPLCAVGAEGPSGPNAQICVSVFGASIVPERPRLLVSLSKTNYTEGLVRESGRLSVTLLSDAQAGLLEPLGLRSGRNENKLAGLEVELTASGAPTFPGGVGALDCEVLNRSTSATPRRSWWRFATGGGWGVSGHCRGRWRRRWSGRSSDALGGEERT